MIVLVNPYKNQISLLNYTKIMLVVKGLFQYCYICFEYCYISIEKTVYYRKFKLFGVIFFAE